MSDTNKLPSDKMVLPDKSKLLKGDTVIGLMDDITALESLLADKDRELSRYRRIDKIREELITLLTKGDKK